MMKQGLSPLFSLFLATCAYADLCAVRDLGLVPNDSSVDNGAILSAAIGAGKVNDTVHFPGGAYYATSTVYDAAKEGLCFTGQGITGWNVAAGDYINTKTGLPQRRGNASVRWIYTGPADQPAWRLQGYGHRIEGINLWRGYKGEARGHRPEASNSSPISDLRPPTSSSVGIEFSRRKIGPPAGKHHVSDYTIAGFDIGVWFKKSGNHVDCMTFEHGRVESCGTSFKCDNPQSTTFEFRGLWILGNQGDTVFDFAGGGNVLVTTLALVGPRLVLKSAMTSNTASFEIRNFKVDNNAANWRLVESRGPLSLTVRGHIGNAATPAADAISVRDYMGQPQHVDVRLRWGGVFWPKATK